MKEHVKDNNHLFEGQTFYLGLDVHKKNIKVTIRNNGRVLKKFSMDPDAQELYMHLKHNYPGGIYKTVYEAGFSGFWFHRDLTRYGISNIIINPADVPSTQKEKTRKTDKVDSTKLARELENQSLEPIYIPTEEEEALRNLSRFRMQIVKENTRTKNRIKSFLSLYNIILPDNFEERHWSRKFINRIKNLEIAEINNKIVLDGLINELEHQRTRKNEILLLIRKFSFGNETIKKLMTIPGIGVIIAFSLYAELYRIDRFNSTDKLCGMIGLVPSVRQSNETKHNLGLTGRANNILRSLILEAAWIAVGKDSSLTSSFNEYCKRMEKNKAIIRIARKLVSRIRFVWSKNQEYVCGVVQ